MSRYIGIDDLVTCDRDRKTVTIWNRRRSKTNLGSGIIVHPNEWSTPDETAELIRDAMRLAVELDREQRGRIARKLVRS